MKLSLLIFVLLTGCTNLQGDRKQKSAIPELSLPNLAQDSKLKVTLFGQVPPSIQCPVISEKFNLLIFGPQPDEKIIGRGSLDDRGGFEITIDTVPGKYQVKLANEKTGKILDTQSIEILARKRIQIKFTSCPDA